MNDSTTKMQKTRKYILTCFYKSVMKTVDTCQSHRVPQPGPNPAQQPSQRLGWEGREPSTLSQWWCRKAPGCSNHRLPWEQTSFSPPKIQEVSLMTFSKITHLTLCKATSCPSPRKQPPLPTEPHSLRSFLPPFYPAEMLGSKVKGPQARNHNVRARADLSPPSSAPTDGSICLSASPSIISWEPARC